MGINPESGFRLGRSQKSNINAAPYSFFPDTLILDISDIKARALKRENPNKEPKMSYAFIVWLAVVAFLTLVFVSLPLKDQPRK